MLLSRFIYFLNINSKSITFSIIIYILHIFKEEPFVIHCIYRSSVPASVRKYLDPVVDAAGYAVTYTDLLIALVKDIFPVTF